MLGALTEKFKGLASRLLRHRTMSEGNIAQAVDEVRQALLDADVNVSVVGTLMERIRHKALGETVLKAVSPGEQFIKLVHDELQHLMGGEPTPLVVKGSPCVMMLCGLQGSGKTTTTAKLAYYLSKNQRKKVLVAACDLQRPAAVEQLKILCHSIGVVCCSHEGEQDPRVVARAAVLQLKKEQYDVLLVDTAGRLHLDALLMAELKDLREILQPQEVVFVLSAAMGQDAVTTAQEFHKQVAFTGTIVTMLDGTARAGAAISVREMTHEPLLFEGMGERVHDLQPFHPGSMADRILGMGDVVNLVRRAQEEFSEQQQEALKKKIAKSAFTYDDYLQQVNSMKRMGPIKGLLQMLPGMPSIPNLEQSEGVMKTTEAIIASMTPEERHEKVELTPSRRWRLAKGSGVTIDQVNGLIKRFKRLKDMMKHMSKDPKFSGLLKS